MVLEKTHKSPLGSKEIKPVNPKGNQPWIFVGRTDAEAESPILWPCDVKSWLIEKDRWCGKDWRQEKKGTTEDEVRWHHRLTRKGLGVGDGQGTLVYCSLWGCKEKDTTEWLNWTEEAGPWLSQLGQQGQWGGQRTEGLAHLSTIVISALKTMWVAAL